eukprot:scaffold169936_cov26-Tisochrysis_lutea.AAC.5
MKLSLFSHSPSRTSEVHSGDSITGSLSGSLDGRVASFVPSAAAEAFGGSGEGCGDDEKKYVMPTARRRRRREVACWRSPVVPACRFRAAAAAAGTALDEGEGTALPAPPRAITADPQSAYSCDYRSLGPSSSLPRRPSLLLFLSLSP